MSHPAAASQSVVDRVRSALYTRLDTAVTPGSRVVLIDFPQHRNAGDSAIFMGERRWLEDRGHELVHTCSLTTYDRALVRRELAGGTLLIHGGGNFGDVWPQWHALRESVAADFPDRPIVQLPQTLHYSSPAAMEAARTAPLGRHEALTLLTRDTRSLALAEELFPRATAGLAPDMAFALGHQSPAAAETDILWLARDDHERAPGEPVTGPGIEVTDWALRPGENALWWSMFAVPKSANRLRGRPRTRHVVAHASERLFAPMAQVNVRGALRTLSRGRVVVTDRLHAHILSLLLGRPHVVMDNSYGKLSTFMDAWTRDAPGVESAPDPRAAAEQARRMVAGMP